MGLALGLLVVAITTEVAATAALPRTASFHHPGWTETLDPDGTLHLTGPLGRTHTTHPPGPRPP